jgi:hypothetical protein
MEDIMRVGFMDTPEDCQWLRETALAGVPLPTRYAGFKSFVLQGNEDSPYAVNLYVSMEPHYQDNYMRYEFDQDPPVYCTGREFDGKTDKPLY